MGYYTKYGLEIVYGDDCMTSYEDEISELAGYHNCFDDSIKWHNYEKDMIEYSKKQPNVLFLISGEGEESGDIWRSYFKNGKVFKTKGKVVFDDFSEDKLE